MLELIGDVDTLTILFNCLDVAKYEFCMKKNTNIRGITRAKMIGVA